jgi:GT2 family glycosyltransferase
MIGYSNYKFAAFVITKDRPDTLFSTVQKLMNQSLPPSFVLVIDNGSQDLTSVRIKELNDERISHHSVGYNAGPAGGAYWGMKLLFERGFDWVLWVDDDDPPKFDDLFEKMFKIVSDNDNDTLGMVGAVGERFDKRKVKIVRFEDKQLKGYLDVDTISGNMFPIVSRRVFQHGLLPTADLFFGFEDLDFSLSLKRSGFRIIISGDIHFMHREFAGRLNLRKMTQTKRPKESLWREYYSVRSLVYIVLYREQLVVGFLALIVRNFLKSFFVFKYGFNYGKKANYMILKGLFDGFFGRMGMRILPITKNLFK